MADVCLLYAGGAVFSRGSGFVPWPARAAPDGHTMLMTVNSYVINPSFFDKVPYDPYKSFDPVTLAVTYTNVLP